MDMAIVIKALQGKKTHLVVLAFIAYVWVTQDPEAAQKTLEALMVSTFKAGMDRNAV